jgi:AbrB family looped-hinge helix DNA binding protein
MQIVRVKDKYQVTIPTSVRQKAGIEVGDVLEARAERGEIVLAPKSIISRRLLDAIREVERGEALGPFKTAGEFFSSLDAETRKSKRKR